MTNDVEFERPTNPTIVWPLVPTAWFSYVPAVDPGCGDAGVDDMLFSAAITDLDVDEQLYAVLRGNPGNPPVRSEVLTIPPTVDRARVRTLRHCQHKASFFTKRCSVATLVVGPDLSTVQNAPLDSTLALGVDTARWILLGPSAEFPDAEDNDCLELFPDAGVP